MQDTLSLKSLAAGTSLLVFLLFSNPVEGEEAFKQEDGGHLQAAAEETGLINATAGLLDSLMVAVSLSASSEAKAEGIESQRSLAPAQKVQGAAVDAPVRAVELMQPGTAEKALQRSFFGRVVARETADLSFPLQGTLVHFPATEGSTVPAGETLAALDLAPFERAVERARIELQQADRAFGRTQVLQERNVVSKTMKEDAESARDLADVALREALDALEDATIVAPYDALVAERLTANHVIVAPGTPIIRVHDISEMHVEIDVPERLVQRYPVIDQVLFQARFPGRGDQVDLRLVEFHAQTEAIGQSYRFTLALPSQTGLDLLPGSSLTVTAVLPKPAPAHEVPVTAIVADKKREPYVMVFEPGDAGKGTVRALPIDVASINGTSFVVRNLPSDIEIVRTGAHLLRDGQTVRRFTGLQVEE